MTIGTSLRDRVIHTTSWIMVGHISGQLLRLVSNLIMTRLLVPEMFGVMAIANIIMIGLSMISDVGIQQHIIQSKRSDSEDFLNTAWVVQIIRGIILWFIALIISLIFAGFADDNWWPADSVYADPMLPMIIVILSFTAVINGFGSTKVAMANRNLAMTQVVKIDLMSQFIGIVLMICWAYIDRSIWALVFGALVSSLLKSVLGHAVLPGNKNKFHWDTESFYELVHFGKWIFLTSILGFLAINGDRLILGGLIDAKMLGLYSIAMFFVAAIQQVFAKVIGSVALPAFSEVFRNRPDDLKKTYYKLRLPIDVATLLATGFLFSVGHLIIEILYDERYHASGYILEILCISLFGLRFSLAGQCFVAMGKPKLLAPLILIKVIVLFTFLPLAFNWWGLDGALWIVAVSGIFTIPFTMYIKIKTGLFDLRHELVILPLVLVGYGFGVILNNVFRVLGWSE